MLESCPFKIGDKVVYLPSNKGKAYDATTPPFERLVSGQEYIIDKIQNSSYIIVKGYNHPGGGMYWTEFSKPSDLRFSTERFSL